MKRSSPGRAGRSAVLEEPDQRPRHGGSEASVTVTSLSAGMVKAALLEAFAGEGLAVRLDGHAAAELEPHVGLRARSSARARGVSAAPGSGSP